MSVYKSYPLQILLSENYFYVSLVHNFHGEVLFPLRPVAVP